MTWSGLAVETCRLVVLALDGSTVAVAGAGTSGTRALLWFIDPGRTVCMSR